MPAGVVVGRRYVVIWFAAFVDRTDDCKVVEEGAEEVDESVSEG